MTKAQAKKRLNEARAKIQLVYSATNLIEIGNYLSPIVSTPDMAAIDKILYKCLKRLN